MDWKQLLTSITSSVDEELRLRNAYLVTENRLLRKQIHGRVQLTVSERRELAAMGQKLGKKALEEIATVAKPDTILAWHRRFADQQCDRAQPQTSVGRPRIKKEIEALVVRMAQENRSWGYDRIVGALANLGYTISAQTVGNILKRHRIPPALERKKTVTWQEFTRVHLHVLLATDFFTHAVWSWLGFVVSVLLCFVQGCHRQVCAVGMTLHHGMWWVLSLLSKALNVLTRVQRWRWLVKLSVRTRPILIPGGGLGQTVSACASSDDRTAQSPARGTVVLFCAASLNQIRAGPIRCRHRLSGLQNDPREAA
jgi:putative transposase